MDKLGTYALVAALKEISKKSAPKPAPNERWISLRSFMTELEQTSIEPAQPQVAQIQEARETHAVPPEAVQMTPIAAPAKRSFTYIKQINQRHQNARRQN